MSYIITTRNPRDGGLLIISDDDSDSPAEFPTEKEAEKEAENVTVCKAWGFNVVEIP